MKEVIQVLQRESDKLEVTLGITQKHLDKAQRVIKQHERIKEKLIKQKDALGEAIKLLGQNFAEQPHNSDLFALDWHNPNNLPTPGEGYRFCLKSEMERDSTHAYSEALQKWLFLGDTCKSSHPLGKDYTYRTNKPLPKDI